MIINQNYLYILHNIFSVEMQLINALPAVLLVVAVAAQDYQFQPDLLVDP